MSKVSHCTVLLIDLHALNSVYSNAIRVNVLHCIDKAQVG